MAYREIPAETWEKIRSEFVVGYIDEHGRRKYPSLRKLSQKYGVHLNTLCAARKSGKWDELRKQHDDTIVTLLVQKSASSIADALARIDDAAVAGAEEFIAAARRGLREYEEMLARVKSDPGLSAAERAMQLRWLSVAMRNFLLALADAHKTARLALEKPTEITEGWQTFEVWYRKTLEYLKSTGGLGEDDAGAGEPASGEDGPRVLPQA
ncbi:MAG: hypothetical protein QXT45_07290 [Candidatus Bilamarchaeaceae archaeon]